MFDSLKIDDYEFTFDEVALTDFVEKGEILTGKNSGRTQDYNMYIEYGGTFYNYSFTIHKLSGCSKSRWDELFGILTDPHCDHDIVMPHNQTEMTFRAYLSSASRSLKNITNGYEWGSISVEFIAMQPQIRY